MPATRYGWEADQYGDPSGRQPEPELVWVPRELDYRMSEFVPAYLVSIHTLLPAERHERLFIHAATGALIGRQNRIKHADEQGVANTRLHGTRQIITDQVEPGKFRLEQTTRNLFVRNQNNAPFPSSSAIEFFDTNNFWDAANGEGDSIAVDAYVAAEDYHRLLESKGWIGLDNEGGQLRAYVHSGEQLANATWNGFSASFGDGSPSSVLDLPLVSHDVVGHEFTHGLINEMADFSTNREAIALDEAFPDIFGVVSNIRANGLSPASWLLASEASSSGVGARSLSQPNDNQYPDTYNGQFWDEDADPFLRSSVISHWFYRMSEGGSGTNDLGNAFAVSGIGWQASFDIAFRTLRVYLGPGATFQDVVYYSDIAAGELFGGCSDEVAALRNAWYAVGLRDSPEEGPTVDFESTPFFCEAPAEVDFQNLSSNYESILWDFGDGNQSDETSPTHTYTAPGFYSVTLNLVDCDGAQTILSRPDYIFIDGDGVVCADYTAPTNATLVASACIGTITDSGGPNDDYGPNEDSRILIEVPGATGITLTFESFNVAFGDDEFYIYDGATVDAPFLFDGTPQTMTGAEFSSTGPAMLVQLVSFGSFQTDGYVATYIAEGSAQPAEAGIGVDAPTAMVGELVTFIDQHTAGEVTTYLYGDGTSGTDPFYTYSQPGTYTIAQIAETCLGADTAYVDIVITGTVSTNDRDPAPAKIFPNPASDYLTIVPNSGRALAVKLFDIHGRWVAEQPSAMGTIRLALPRVATGIYLLQMVDTEGYSWTERIVVE